MWSLNIFFLWCCMKCYDFGNSPCVLWTNWHHCCYILKWLSSVNTASSIAGQIMLCRLWRETNISSSVHSSKVVASLVFWFCVLLRLFNHKERVRNRINILPAARSYIDARQKRLVYYFPRKVSNWFLCKSSILILQDGRNWSFQKYKTGTF